MACTLETASKNAQKKRENVCNNRLWRNIVFLRFPFRWNSRIFDIHFSSWPGTWLGSTEIRRHFIVRITLFLVCYHIIGNLWFTKLGIQYRFAENERGFCFVVSRKEQKISNFRNVEITAKSSLNLVFFPTSGQIKWFWYVQCSAAQAFARLNEHKYSGRKWSKFKF